MSLALVRGIHQWPVNSLHKRPVTWKMVPLGDVRICWQHFALIWTIFLSQLQWHHVTSYERHTISNHDNLTVCSTVAQVNNNKNSITLHYWPLVRDCGWFHRLSLGMDKSFLPTLYNGCSYLSMLGLKLIHVNKRGYCDAAIILICGDTN